MTGGERSSGVGPVTYNVDRILDAHTHLTGRESAEEYREEHLQPQLGLFETVATLGHIVQEGSPAREEHRNIIIFFQNALDHWQNALREPQNPRPALEPIEAPNAHRGHSHG